MNRTSSAETSLPQATHKPGDFLHVPVKGFIRTWRDLPVLIVMFSGGKQNNFKYSKANLQNSVLRFSLPPH